MENGQGIAVVIVAAGRGTRMAGSQPGALPKQFLLLDGVPVLVRTVRRMLRALPGAQVTVVLAGEYLDFWAGLCRRWDLEGTHCVCAGGDTRFESVCRALDGLEACEWIAVHDGVRPFVTGEVIRRTLDAAVRTGAAIPVVEPVDSLRRLTPEGSQPVDRAMYRAVQTPQVFRASLLREAYRQPCRPQFTDDASVVESYGAQIALSQGDRRNIKLTSPEDMITAEAWLHAMPEL